MRSFTSNIRTCIQISCFIGNTRDWDTKSPFFTQDIRDAAMSLIVQRILLFIIFTVSYTNVYANIVYRIKHIGNNLLVHAEFGKHCSTNKIEELYIPENIWGADYSKQIKNLKFTKNNSSNNYSIEYNIINLKHDELVNTFGSRYYHFFDKNRFFLFGLGLFVLPQNLLKQKDIKVTIIFDSTAKQIASTTAPYFSNIFERTINKLDDLIFVGDKRLNHLQDKNLNTSVIPNPIVKCTIH